MSINPRIPTPRALDIYRLVIARRLKQRDVAQSFGVTPPRITQIIRRVRDWVNHSVGDWLFPGSDDYRLYVALHLAQICVHEHNDDPQTVELIGPGWSYARNKASLPLGERGESALADSPGDGLPTRSVSEDPEASTDAPGSANIPAHVSTKPVNSPAAPSASPLGATPTDQANCDSQTVNLLATCLAQLLIDWKKSRSLTSAFRQPS